MLCCARSRIRQGSYAPCLLPTAIPPGSHRELFAPYRLRWGIGANRLCPRAAVIPAPSFRGRAAALGRPAQGGRVAHALALYRRLVAPWGRALFAHCGGLAALARRLAAAGACRSAAAGAPVLRFASLAARRLRSWAARLPAFLRCGSFLRLGGRLCSGFAGPAAPLWAPGGRRFRPFLALCAVFPPCSLGFSAAAPCRLASPCGGLRRRSGFYRGDVAFSASPGSWARPGRDGRQVLRSSCADAKASPGYVPLNGCFPCPSSFAAENPGLTNKCLCCTIIHGDSDFLTTDTPLLCHSPGPPLTASMSATRCAIPCPGWVQKPLDRKIGRFFCALFPTCPAESAARKSPL